MPPILVKIQPRPGDHGEANDLEAAHVEAVDVEVVEDLDEIVEATMCSCNAGDDNPY